jgi:hypothetical protein
MEDSYPRFMNAVVNGDSDEVARILKECPSIIGRLSAFGSAPFYIACHRDHHKVLRILLAHPDVTLGANIGKSGWSLFITTCSRGSTECAKVLLEDPGTDLNVITPQGNSALVQAVLKGNHDIIRWWIASGRELDLNALLEGEEMLEMAVQRDRTHAILDFLGKFKADPEGTRHRVRAELGFKDELAADVLSSVVFLCDGLLRVSPLGAAWGNVGRFYRIASLLPQELQMVLCYRVVGSAMTNIPAKLRERGFRDLAQVLKKNKKK